MQNSDFREETIKMSNKSIVSFFRKRTYLVALLFCLPVGAIYFSCAVRITPNVFVPTGGGYYTYLLDAFFHGRTNVTSPRTYDLSLFENKWYAYWGPAPVLLILPFYLVSHLQASDVLYTVIGGTVNVALFYFVMQEFKKSFQISLSFVAEAFLVLSFGLASPNFFLSLTAITPYTVQIFSVTYLLLFYLLYFRFLKSEKHCQLILCAVFFCLACLSRYTLVFNGILFVYLFVHGKRLGRAIPTKIILYVGATQFGYRYFFDIIPLIFFLMMFILPYIPIFIQVGLLGYGIFVNFYGIMAFYNLLTDIPTLQATLFWIVVVLSILSFLSTIRLDGT